MGSARCPQRGVVLTSFDHAKPGATLPPTRQQSHGPQTTNCENEWAHTADTHLRTPPPRPLHSSPMLVAAGVWLTEYEEVSVVEKRSASGQSTERAASAVCGHVEVELRRCLCDLRVSRVEHAVGGVVIRRVDIIETRVAATKLPLNKQSHRAYTHTEHTVSSRNIRSNEACRVLHSHPAQ